MTPSEIKAAERLVKQMKENLQQYNEWQNVKECNRLKGEIEFWENWINDSNNRS